MKIREGYHSEQIRNEAYKDALDLLNKEQRRVYEVIKEHQPIYSERIATILGKYPHLVTPRVLELRALELVEFAGEGISETSGYKVSLWRIKIKQGKLFS